MSEEHPWSGTGGDDPGPTLPSHPWDGPSVSADHEDGLPVPTYPELHPEEGFHHGDIEPDDWAEAWQEPFYEAY
jgi:hypothetical protein